MLYVIWWNPPKSIDYLVHRKLLFLNLECVCFYENITTKGDNYLSKLAHHTIHSYLPHITF